ncbi:MAG: head GIN domain-containing protein [Flavobacteriales bacterium]
MSRSFIILLMVPFLLTTACKKEQMGDCLKSRGKTVERSRSIKGVRAIELHDHVELVIEKSANEGVEVRAGKNLIPLIKTKMEEDTLVIRDENTCDWVRSYEPVPKVTVRTKALTHLFNHSTADISCKGSIQGPRFHYAQWNGMGNVELTLHTDTCWLKAHTGSGDLRCHGSSDMAYLYSSGTAFLRLRDLECQKAWATNKGSGNMYLNVQGELKAFVHSLGSIYYHGKPTLTKAVREGEGKIEMK